jgi:hypothetical protein
VTGNRNETEKFGIAPEQVEAVFARSEAEAIAEGEARRRAEAWPREVEQVLAAAAVRIAGLEARLAALEAGRG